MFQCEMFPVMSEQRPVTLMTGRKYAKYGTWRDQLCIMYEAFVIFVWHDRMLIYCKLIITQHNFWPKAEV